MIDLNEIQAFVKVAELKSYTKAAAILGIPKSNVSRKVAQLEERLSIRLIQRTTRTINLTEAGRVYYSLCQKGFTTINDAECMVSSLQASPKGLLRITLPVDVGYYFAREVFPEFLAAYPEIQIETILKEERLDLIKEEIDLAIRVGKHDDSSLVAKKIGIAEKGIFTTKDYLKKYGMPDTPKDLEDHHFLIFKFKNNYDSLTLSRGKQKVEISLKGRFISNNFTAIRESLLAGCGIAVVPTIVFDKTDNQVVKLFPDWDLGSADLSILYPSRKYVTPKMKAFFDFIESKKLKFK